MGINKNMKKGIASFVVILFFVSSFSAIAMKGSVKNNVGQITVTEIHQEKQYLSMPKQDVKEVPLKQVKVPMIFNYDHFVFDGIHPGFGRAESGMQMAAYRDEDFGQVIWTFSADDGETYDAGVYYDTNSDYPSIKLWNGDRFFGTMLPDYEDSSGAAAYVFECTDPSDTGTYTLLYWDWSANGWSDFNDIEIAVDDSAEAWEWGFLSIVADSTYTSPPANNGAYICYQTSEAGQGGIGELIYTNCDHTDAAIDPVTAKTYAVYDRDIGGGTWGLLIRNDLFTNWDGATTYYEISGAGNLKNPAVSANDGNMVLLAETDENGNKDIICLYGNAASPSTSFVADSGDDEIYSDVRYREGSTFICTFFKNDCLYASKTIDAGATWCDPVLISDNVVVEYKASDLGEKAVKLMYEGEGGVHITDVFPNQLPDAPMISGELNGKVRKSYDYTFESSDPEGQDIWYYIDWGDNSSEDWIGPFDSGEEIIVNHTWDKWGRYLIKAKVKDTFNGESDWSYLEIIMPVNQLVQYPMFHWFLERFPNAFPIMRHLLGF